MFFDAVFNFRLLICHHLKRAAQQTRVFSDVCRGFTPAAVKLPAGFIQCLDCSLDLFLRQQEHFAHGPINCGFC